MRYITPKNEQDPKQKMTGGTTFKSTITPTLAQPPAGRRITLRPMNAQTQSSPMKGAIQRLLSQNQTTPQQPRTVSSLSDVNKILQQMGLSGISDSNLQLPTPQTPTQTSTKVQTPSTKGKTGIDADLANAMLQYQDFLSNAKDDFLNAQTAQLEAMRQQQITDLQKALFEAVQQGQIDMDDAQKAYQDAVEQINQNAYLSAQQTNLSGQERGIQNSQQMIALQQGNQRATAKLRNDAVTARDDRLADIRNRIAQVTNNFNLDVTNANTQYNQGLLQAQAQASQMFNQGMSDLTLGQYKAYLELKNNLTLQEQEQLNILERMEKQYGYDLNKMKVQHGYDLENMSVQQKYDLQKMAKQQEYTRSNMALQQKYDLAKMKTQHGYDLEKMAKQQSYDLQKMAKQYGYDMAKISKEQQNAIARINAQASAQMKAQNAAYLAQRKAVEASYTPGTPEYKIRMAQIEEANDQAMRQYANKALFDSLTKIVKPGTPAFQKLLTDPAFAVNNYAEFSRTGATGYTELHAR